MSFRINKTHTVPKPTKTVTSEVDNFLSDDFLFNLDNNYDKKQQSVYQKPTQPRKTGQGMYIRSVKEAEADFF